MAKKLEQLWMWKFQFLLFVLKRSYICYYIMVLTKTRNDLKRPTPYNEQETTWNDLQPTYNEQETTWNDLQPIYNEQETT